jgi:hypothetical protein
MKSEFTLEMIAEAKVNPGGHVYEIDWHYPDDQAVPPEAIRGGWKVDDEGELTTVFTENPDYREVRQAIREPQEYMLRALVGANHIRNCWVVEIDPEHHDQFPDVPIEWQIGRWYVGEDGNYTGQFRPNHKYLGSVET